MRKTCTVDANFKSRTFSQTKLCDLLLVTSQIEQDETISNNQILQGALSSVSTLTIAPVSISIKNDVLTAEVLWALKISSSHYSHKSSKLLFTKCFLIV